MILRQGATCLLAAPLLALAAAGSVGLEQQGSFDCDEGYQTWEIAWSDAKRNWCCRVGRGCPETRRLDAGPSGPGSYGIAGRLAPTAALATPSVAPPWPPAATQAAVHDCNRGFPQEISAWSVGKRAWCCLHQGRACPEEAAAATATTLTATSTETTSALRGVQAAAASPPKSDLGCDAVCLEDDVSSTCAARIDWLQENKAEECQVAHANVLKECAVCSECDLVASCPRSAGGTATTTPAPTCTGSCSLDGRNVSCADRIRTVAAEGHFQGKPGACKLSHVMVLLECPSCDRCDLTAVGCVQGPGSAAAPVPATTAPTEELQYDCLSAASDWSADHQSWCCENLGRGCESDGSSTAPAKLYGLAPGTHDPQAQAGARWPPAAWPLLSCSLVFGLFPGVVLARRHGPLICGRPRQAEVLACRREEEARLVAPPEQ